MTREETWNLLEEYNKEPFHLEHGEIVGKTLKYFANKLGWSLDELIENTIKALKTFRP